MSVGGSASTFGFGSAGPALVIDHAHLQLADAGEVFFEFVAVLAANFGAEGTAPGRSRQSRMLASVIDPLQSDLDGVAFAFEKEHGECPGRGNCAG